MEQTFWSEELVGLAPLRLGLGLRPTSEAILSRPHVLVSTRGAVSGNLDAALATHARMRRVAAAVPSCDGAARLCAEASYLFFCGRRLAERFERLYGLARFEAPLAVPGFQVKPLWNRRDARSPSQTWLRTRLSELGAREPPRKTSSRRRTTARDS